MPIDATPFEHVVVAVAANFVGEPTVLLLAGEFTYTPDLAVTEIVIGVVDAPPQ
jgi:hypothetical protein